MNKITQGGHIGPLNDWFDLSQEGSIRLNWFFMHTALCRKHWVKERVSLHRAEKWGGQCPLKRTSSSVSGVALCLEMNQALESRAVKGAESSIQIIRPLLVLKWGKKRRMKTRMHIIILCEVGWRWGVAGLPQFYTGDNPRKWTVKALGISIFKRILPITVGKLMNMLILSAACFFPVLS